MIENFRFQDEDDYENEIFHTKVVRARQPAGKTGEPSSFYYEF